MRGSDIRRLIWSWMLLVFAWLVYDLAETHRWYSVIGAAVVVRCIALYLGASVARRLWRASRPPAEAEQAMASPHLFPEPLKENDVP